jgi:hypothetical protein
VVHGHIADLADRKQGHRVLTGVRVPGGEGEPWGPLVAHEERGDRQAELVGEVRRQEVTHDLRTAFD